MSRTHPGTGAYPFVGLGSARSSAAISLRLRLSADLATAGSRGGGPSVTPLPSVDGGLCHGKAGEPFVFGRDDVPGCRRRRGLREHVVEGCEVVAPARPVADVLCGHFPSLGSARESTAPAPPGSGADRLDMHPARVELFGRALDRAALARGIPPFERDDAAPPLNPGNGCAVVSLTSLPTD